ncbi:cyclic GMP-AMP synthase isoform X2 [Pipistrellus kuhlii]|uniref:cyclic GMP-AMP synthase isoform X2 n=1 Tax=Pipistrellus kuhlii TaxID=59472 RepID=UPI00174EE678|nr:cyclic GMP-AMP synthase isoform X2 [Pipistrellus kuhlii]
MDPRSGKATRIASKISAQSANGAPAKPTPAKPTPAKPTPAKRTPAKRIPAKPIERPVVPEAAQPNEQECSSTGASGNQQKKSAPGSRERPQGRARGARSEKAPLSSEDTVDGHTEPAAAPGPPLPRAGSRPKGGACAKKAPLSAQVALDGQAGLAQELDSPLPRAGSRRKGGACAKKAPLSSEDTVDGHTELAVAPEPPPPRAGSRRKGGACAKKEPLSAEDILNGQAILAEGPEPPAAPESPLPRAGSARSAGERRPPSRPAEDAGQDPPAAASSRGGREAVLGAYKLGAVVEKLKLRRAEISEAASVVNRLEDHLLRGLKSGQSEFKGVEVLHTGSYYEQVKVSAPNEFDIMFTLDVPRIQLEEYRDSGAHYFMKFKRNPKGNPLNQFLEGEILSASKMLSKFRELIKKEIKNIEDMDIIMEKKKKGCPAVTLLIKTPKEISVDIILALKVKSSWPRSTQDGMPIENWLGGKVKKSLKLQPFYLVPKPAKEGNVFQEETWRLSFSHIEKDILKNHGDSKKCCESKGVKCCRKRCLQLMKYLLEKLKEKFEDRKELGEFCSYHVKTAFFHVCAQNPHDIQWRDNLELCFNRCLEYFLQCLKTQCLENFFIPAVNLFSQDKINRISKEFLLKEIEYERNNRFPIFGEF